jgi:hypothetical protein
MIGVTHDRLGDRSGSCGIHLFTIIEVGCGGLTIIIVVRKDLATLPEHLKVRGACSIGTGNRSNEERRDLACELGVASSRGQVNNNPILKVGALGEVERIGEGEGTWMVLNDHDILVFHSDISFSFSS